MHRFSKHLAPSAEEVYATVRRDILPRLDALTACRSSAELRDHAVYRTIAPDVDRMLATAHVADYRRGEAPARERYRILAWNIERGTELEGQLRAFREHPYLRECDVLLITEADCGMARSGNHMVAERLAGEL